MAKPANQNEAQRIRNWLLGRMGEHLVERILTRAGFEVVPFGYERTAPQIKDVVSKDRSEAAMRIRSTPDLLVVSPEGQTGLVQVKTTTSANSYLMFEKAALQEEKYWTGAVYIIVNLNINRLDVWLVEKFHEQNGKYIFFFEAENGSRPLQLSRRPLFGAPIPKEIIEEELAGAAKLINDLSGAQCSTVVSDATEEPDFEGADATPAADARPQRIYSMFRRRRRAIK